MPEKEIRLKVAEAIQDDVNKGIVRVDSQLMSEIGVKPGDIVELEGEGKTVGIVDRAYPGDIGLNIIRMDGILRRNAKTGIGELIKVRKADVKEAKKVKVKTMAVSWGFHGRAALKKQNPNYIVSKPNQILKELGIKIKKKKKKRK